MSIYVIVFFLLYKIYSILPGLIFCISSRNLYLVFQYLYSKNKFKVYTFGFFTGNHIIIQFYNGKIHSIYINFTVVFCRIFFWLKINNVNGFIIKGRIVFKCIFISCKLG